jgi:3-hydroxybutyryl-CoA dehydrogenase
MIAGVVGAGAMGLGIAHAFAVSGIPVVACEPDDAARERAAARFTSVLEDGVRRGKLSEVDAGRARDCFRLVSRIADLPDGADVVIESAPEKLDLKRGVLHEIEGRAPVLLGTNTSSLSIDELARDLDRPDRLLGFHFFNPVWAKRLVEIVVGSATSGPALEQALDTVRAIGKEAITVQDAPGFATSRLGVLLGLEAIRILESGIASAEDIDLSMTGGYGHPMGPLRLTDLVGLDVRLDIARYLATVYGDRFTPPALLEQMVAEGRLGQKSGRGFFTW